MKPILLRGITWNHSRALPPLVATAQRFEELHPNIHIQWEKRTLHEFGHADLAMLAANFDLLVIDHPMAGDAERTGAIHDLRPLLTAAAIQDLEEDSAGPSFASYNYQGKLYALPIDAAAPAASYRPDLLQGADQEPPQSWSDLVKLAQSGHVRMPAFSADLFLNFLGLCVTQGSPIAAHDDQLVDHAIGAASLDQLRELAALMPPEIYKMNPIAIYERMSTSDDFAYCPFAYTYSNYSRPGFSERPLRFANPVSLAPDLPVRTVLGGTGIAIASQCKEVTIALEYSLFTASRVVQSSLYGIHGGQPARRSAWQDATLNQLSDNFFERTLTSIQSAYVRPRYPGYVSLQETAGAAIAHYCQHGGWTQDLLLQIDALYRETRQSHFKKVDAQHA